MGLTENGMYVKIRSVPWDNDTPFLQCDHCGQTLPTPYFSDSEHLPDKRASNTFVYITYAGATQAIEDHECPALAEQGATGTEGNETDATER